VTRELVYSAAVSWGGNKPRRLIRADAGYTPPDEEILAIDDALTLLAVEDAQAARLIQPRYFGGLSVEEAAEAVGLSRSSAYEHWAYARVPCAVCCFVRPETAPRSI
jgi:hypothetical protein